MQIEVIMQNNVTNLNEDGTFIECYTCKGTGNVDIRTGLFGADSTTAKCSYCKGIGKIHINMNCPFTDRVCSKHFCNLWDKEHDGGCLQRKALIVQIYGNERTIV